MGRAKKEGCDLNYNKSAVYLAKMVDEFLIVDVAEIIRLVDEQHRQNLRDVAVVAF